MPPSYGGEALQWTPGWWNTVASWSDGTYWIMTASLTHARLGLSQAGVGEFPSLLASPEDRTLTRLLSPGWSRPPRERAAALRADVDLDYAAATIVRASRVRAPKELPLLAHPRGAMGSYEAPPRLLTVAMPGLTDKESLTWVQGSQRWGVLRVARFDGHTVSPPAPIVTWVATEDRTCLTLIWAGTPDESGECPGWEGEASARGQALLTLMALFGEAGYALSCLPFDVQALGGNWYRYAPRGDTIVGIEHPERLDRSQWGRCAIYAHPEMVRVLFW